MYSKRDNTDTSLETGGYLDAAGGDLEGMAIAMTGVCGILRIGMACEMVGWAKMK